MRLPPVTLCRCPEPTRTFPGYRPSRSSSTGPGGCSGTPLTPADLRLVAEIVRRLDGIPLAIELAAGRLSTFALADLHQRLDRSLDLLGGRPSGEARHGTLWETVEWSYRLLTEDERRLFRHLSVFADGVDLATAERLGAALGLGSDPGSALARLVDVCVSCAISPRTFRSARASSR